MDYSFIFSLNQKIKTKYNSNKKQQQPHEQQQKNIIFYINKEIKKKKKFFGYKNVGVESFKTKQNILYMKNQYIFIIICFLFSLYTYFFFQSL
jgi:ATP-dependent Zn protease